MDDEYQKPVTITGVVLSEEDYQDLMTKALLYDHFSQELETLEVARSAQAEQVDYFLNPNGGYAQAIERQEERERIWLQKVRENPQLAWRVKNRR